ncbi:ankyrin repeat domain-containing protein [Paenibacillus sp. WQ 127069]|uniref:Ankyrin repeat domain-containing protein n=1 Tax=Paenibacillus baimaensis TaxID=2982185 RepID=A0ABT2UDA1_9BACL|nr:ankyrin repeat domain-containing protein [Paenibacillus sp. WQ 127069]MCU6792623.1 ankyrin repeat domain-containing protein [Paenibacillus sp. WQ 127069]
MNNKIFTAAAVGDIEYLKNVLSTGIDINCKSETGWTLLVYAVENDRKEMVEFLLNNGADVNFQSSGGWTPLHQAVDLSIDGTIQTGGEQGEEPLDMIKFLLDNGAKVDKKDSRGVSPIDIAKSYHSKKIIDFLEHYSSNSIL